MITPLDGGQYPYDLVGRTDYVVGDSDPLGPRPPEPPSVRAALGQDVLRESDRFRIRHVQARRPAWGHGQPYPESTAYQFFTELFQIIYPRLNQRGCSLV